MRYGLLIYTNEADRPVWGTPEGDAEAKSVRVRDGRTQIADGPAVQTSEQLGGYYLVECNDLDEALELAAKIPGASYGTIEVRPVLELPS